MKILIDIGHPAHVHYFKNFIQIMQTKGHDFLICARNKEMTFELLKIYNINFINRGNGGKGLLGKLKYLVNADKFLYRAAKKFKPDLFLSFSSPYAAHVSKLVGKPHIAFDDTEHARFEHVLYVPFTDSILTPVCFKKNLGSNHLRFYGTMDLAYLHPNVYMPDPSWATKQNLTSSQPIILIRYVSWEASHDKGYKGLSVKDKIELVNSLKNIGRIYISSESPLPDELIEYKLSINPTEIYDFMSLCSLFIGESGSMATEAAVLGTPAIVCNSAADLLGSFDYFCSFGSLFKITSAHEISLKAHEILKDPGSKSLAKEIARKIIRESIDLTSFMVWFVENYPDSHKIIKSNSAFQFQFKSENL